MIKGITVTLIEKKENGSDEFDTPIYTESKTLVDNVLVAPATTDDLPSDFDFFGKKAVYKIAIPKGDNHVWADNKVEFFGMTWQVIGFPRRGIEENIPLEWNDVWMVEQYG